MMKPIAERSGEAFNYQQASYNSLQQNYALFDCTQINSFTNRNVSPFVDSIKESGSYKDKYSVHYFAKIVGTGTR